jgi:hypothetical protein
MALSRAIYCSSVLIAALLLVVPSSAVVPHAFFIFGDSLVDAGNNDYLVTLSKANAPPYGVDFAFSGGEPTGRFTNGMTIADIMGNVKCESFMSNFDCIQYLTSSSTTLSGEALGQKSLAPPYLAPNSSAAVASSGINYGSGSSGIFDDTGSFYVRQFIS